MSQIIAIYSSPELQKKELPEYLNPIISCWVLSYQGEDGDEHERYYRVEAQLHDCTVISHYIEGSSSTHDFALAYGAFNALVGIINANVAYADNRNSRAESTATF
ncbi:hypothetical protein ACVOZ6_004688 [Escherichia coli]